VRIKHTIERIPGGLMIVPLFLGALCNTIDAAHYPLIMDALRDLGAAPVKPGVYEFFRIGSFTEALFKSGALALIALFLFCSASQMNLRISGVAAMKGTTLLLTKFGVGVGVGYLLQASLGPAGGWTGLAAMTIIAGMTNGNGGMYAALTGQYGNRSDIGALSILSLNDGPFLTMVALGIFSGEHFPAVAFLSVLLPIAIGMALGNLDEEMRTFLAPGERLLVPFFAFALGANMNLAAFMKPEALVGGLVIGVGTVVCTGGAMWLAFALLGYRSRIAAAAEASVAGNATATPAAIAAVAASAAAGAVAGSPEAAAAVARAAAYQDLVSLANAQISIAVITTAILCPIAVMAVDRWQRARGIIGTQEG
jgi:2-keto-3-deoxygluconate permease